MKPQNIMVKGTVKSNDGSTMPGVNVSIKGTSTGTTTGGHELKLAWSYLYPNGIPATGASFALAAVLVNSDGSDISNQVLPPQAVEDAVADGTLSIDAVVVVEVDANGLLVANPVVEP